MTEKKCIDCGKKIIRKIYTYSKLSFLCPKCSMHRIIKKNDGKTTNYTGTDFYTGKEYAAWKSSCKRRGYKWDITKDFLVSLFKNQKGKCALSGVELEYLKQSPYRPSLDRIDSEKDYTEDNVQFVCSIINVMKNKFTEKTFIDMCHAVSKKNIEG